MHFLYWEAFSKWAFILPNMVVGIAQFLQGNSMASQHFWESFFRKATTSIFMITIKKNPYDCIYLGSIPRRQSPVMLSLFLSPFFQNQALGLLIYGGVFFFVCPPGIFDHVSLLSWLHHPTMLHLCLFGFFSDIFIPAYPTWLCSWFPCQPVSTSTGSSGPGIAPKIPPTPTTKFCAPASLQSLHSFLTLPPDTLQQGTSWLQQN